MGYSRYLDIKLIYSYISTYFKNKLNSNKTDVFYIVELHDWSIKWDGILLRNNINRFEITPFPVGIKNKIIHFGTDSLFKINFCKHNNVILTYFHISPHDSKISNIAELTKDVKIIHTSCNLTKSLLIQYGIEKNKIVVIPIPIDLNVFTQFSEEKRLILKNKLKLPDNKIIIGSFQKDGVGWGEGMEPKLIKGPDIFCDVIERLAKQYNIHILLTGPARGYVIDRLKKANISYSHHYLKNYLDIVDYYNVLDLYIVASRVEGGPKAILESMACGVPIISTKVGQAPEIIQNGKNGFISDIEDVDDLLNNCKLVIENKDLRNIIVEQALIDVRNFTIEKIANRYSEELYKPLM